MKSNFIGTLVSNLVLISNFIIASIIFDNRYTRPVMNALFAYFTSLGPVPEELLDYLTEVGRMERFARKSYLLKAGQVCRYLYFVEYGLLRCSYCRGTKEISSGFAREGELCMGAESFFSQQIGYENIEVIENCMVCYIGYADLQCIYRDFPAFNAGARILMEKCIVCTLQRFAALWMQGARDRYEWFLSRFPELDRRVPAKYLASYLGMTEVTLSIIKKGKKRMKGQTV